MSERKEAWMRILVLIVSGIILGLWKIVIVVVGVVHWIIVVITGKREKYLAEISEMWNTQMYVFLRYLTFVTNQRPFPFSPQAKSLSKFEKR